MTGRRRRCGWIDAVALRLAARVNGLTGIALTKMDTLGGFDPVKICIEYKVDWKNGPRSTRRPARILELQTGLRRDERMA